MMIVPTKGEKVIVQGMTGKYGSLHTKLMLEYGTKVVGGVTPGKGGQSVEGVPVYNTPDEAVKATGARVSILFVPAAGLLSAATDAMNAGVKLLVAITEHVPIRDTLRLIELAQRKGATVIGPNTPGLIMPSIDVKLGIMPAPSFRSGDLALFSRSGTLMYEVANELSKSGHGQLVALGIGGDPINCTTMTDCFDWVAQQREVRGVVVVGEIGGDAEERLAQHIASTRFPKPVFAYIAGRAAPREKHMGHAGAIIYGNFGTAESKISALSEAGVKVAKTTMQLPSLVEKSLRRS